MDVLTGMELKAVDREMPPRKISEIISRSLLLGGHQQSSRIMEQLTISRAPNDMEAKKVFHSRFTVEAPSTQEQGLLLRRLARFEPNAVWWLCVTWILTCPRKIGRALCLHHDPCWLQLRAV